MRLLQLCVIHLMHCLSGLQHCVSTRYLPLDCNQLVTHNNCLLCTACSNEALKVIKEQAKQQQWAGG